MSTPAGWYDDGSGRQRWWDGSQWTEHFAPSATPETPAPAAESAPIAGSAPAYEPPAAESTPAYEPPAIPAAPGFDANAVSAPGYTPPAGQAPGAYGTSPYAAPAYPEATTETATKKKPHLIAWLGLGAAALGFILACIPGILIAGWILLPIGLILSIVAFFLQGAKWPAITGVIVAVVGSIVAVIVFFAVIVASAQQAFEEFEDTVTQPTDPTETEEDSDASSGEAGTRENPLPLGSTIVGDEYEVVIESVTLDATADVVAASPINEEPAEGSSYALVSATVTYTGAESGYAVMALIDYITSSGEVISSTESLVVPPEPALALQELYTDASATGNIVLEVPVGDDGLLRVTPGLFGDEFFVALQ